MSLDSFVSKRAAFLVCRRAAASAAALSFARLRSTAEVGSSGARTGFAADAGCATPRRKRIKGSREWATVAKRFELPPEARALLTQVSELGDRLHGLRNEFNRDVARARAAVEVELRHLFEAQQAVAEVDSAEDASASRLIEMRYRLAASAEPGGETAEVESLREQVALLESRRDALLEEGRRRRAAEREEMLKSFAAREQRQASDAQAARDRLDKRTAEAEALLDEKRAALERDRAAFSAANEGHVFRLTGLLAAAWAD